MGGMPYKLADFDYVAPRELIAQHPLARRDASRLLSLDRATGAVTHETFERFPEHLSAGDVLVINTSRVIKARLFGIRENGRQAEVLLVHPAVEGGWLAMVHPGGKLKEGRTLHVGDDAVLHVADVVGGGLRRLELTGAMDWQQLMDRFGTVPLPPYMERAPEPKDESRYQTVFAEADGSVAAPTAGLHFTPEILEQIASRDVRVAEVVLHVGPGTFKPMQVDDPAQHEMHAEWYSIPAETAETVNAAKQHGGRVWAVGTTATRVLETAGGEGELRAHEGWTDLFIYPPYRFRIVDGLLTNFHLPRSTLLMLVCAFAGYEGVMQAYREALAARYRLFSYGDAMVIA